MIRAIMELGRLYPYTELDRLPEGHLITVELKSSGDVFLFEQISVEEIDSAKIQSYLYKKGNPNGPNFSQKSIITEPEKTFDLKVLGWFRRIMKDFKGQSDLEQYWNYVKKVRDYLEQNEEQILNETKQEISDFSGF